MDRILKIILLLTLPTIILGCATTQYNWGDYSNKLYYYYKNPTPEIQEKLTNDLEKIFSRVEKKGAKPPPGLYAEYGTFLFKTGDYPRAINFYTKEKTSWPDSTQFMDSLINALSKQMEKESEGNS